jgi:hypothetical protein
VLCGRREPCSQLCTAFELTQRKCANTAWLACRLYRRLAYVAVSRGRYDAQIYTNEKGQLAEQLSRDVSRRSAMEPNHESVSSAHKTERSSASSQIHEHTQAEGQSISR